MINPTNFLIEKASPIRKFVTKLDKSGAILPVILLEGAVTGGRTYQAYKRDGFVEARERVTEESLGAIFWLFGATMFGALFDKIGQMFMRIPKDMPDVGVDSVRSPFKNYIQKMGQKLNVSPEYLAKFSVGKTAASLITACLFIGYVVPKVNQAITKHLYGKMSKADPNHEKGPNPYTNKLTIKDARSIFSAKGVSINAVENFKASKAMADGLQQNSSANISFKGGADSLLRIVQNFEENAIWKLMGTDVGTVSGRTINARNNDERVEILFRDLSSIYFYCFSMPAIVAFMNKKDAFGGLNTKLNPMSAMEVHNHLIQKMAQAGMDEKVSAKTFEQFALGSDKYQQDFMRLFPDRGPAPVKKYLFGLIKVKKEHPIRTITLADFEAQIEKFAKPEDIDRLKNVARRMSELMQPERQGVKLLTEFQVEDILKGGVARQPEFLSETINNIFKTKSVPKPLTDPYKYMPIDKIKDRRDRIIGYVKAIIKDAQETGEVTAQRMVKLNKRNMTKNGLFMGLAMGVSALFLSTIIPKIQYYITYLRTGKNSFPGTENLTQDK